MERTEERPRLPNWLLVAAPLLLLAAVVFVWSAIDAVGEVGPLDRAKLGWLIGVPLTIAVPVLAAWAGARLRRSSQLFLAAIVGVGAAVAVGWPVWTSYASQCAALGLPVPFSPIVTISSIVGATMFASVLAAGAALDGSRSGPTRIVRAFVSATVVFAVGFGIFALMSGYLLFGHCVVRPGITP